MPLHITLLTPDAATPGYLLTCARTLHRTVVDPTHPADVITALGEQPLDLILLTTLTPATAKAALTLHLHTRAPVLASEDIQTEAKSYHLPLARVLTDGDIVGLGPLAQTLELAAPVTEAAEGEVPQLLGPTIMAYAVGTEGVLFVGPLFAEAPRRPLPPTLEGLPEDWLVFGGHAPEATLKTAPTLGSLLNPGSVRPDPQHPLPLR